MFQLLITFFFSMLMFMAQAQTPRVQNAEFEKELKRLLSFSVRTMDVTQLHAQLSSAVVLDAREPAEYGVSHIPGAKNLGFKQPDWSVLNGVPKDATVVVYCSVGYRSEKMAEKLKKLGFTNVFNLYGSIFEWANRGLPLEDNSGQPVNVLHTFNEKWSRWVQNPAIQKTW